jgi:uncharacterized protein YabE (DUF348 family)
MKSRYLNFLAVTLILVGMILIGLETHKTITVLVDGEAQTVQVFAFKVAGALRSAGIAITTEDQIDPAPDQWLADGQGITITRSMQAEIQADGKHYSLNTPERLPANLLAMAGVRLFPQDQLLVDGKEAPLDERLSSDRPHSIQVKRAVQIQLTDGTDSKIFYTTAATLGQALEQNGIQLHNADRLTPPAGTSLDGDEWRKPLQVEIKRSRPVQIQLQDQQINFRSAADTTGEALAEAGITLQGLDYSQPNSQAALPKNGKIKVVRVQERVLVEQEPLPFETELQPVDDLELDSRKVVQAGEFGLTARSVRIRYEDGQEVSRTVEDEWIARQPQTRVLGYGTQIKIRTLSTPDGPIQYWRAVQMYATSYSPCRIYKDHCDSYTALGETLRKGIVAMTNQWCRYTCGDQVYVPGYGVGTVADTGGGIPGRYWIDLGYSEEDYVSWHQNVTVYFLTPVPSNIMWVLP